jgi:hypothetical protein
LIIRLVNEKNLVKATEVKLIKTSDYQDTLTFKLPIDEEIAVDELIGVRTKVMKQDYRVKEIITKDKYRDVYCEHKFFDCKNIIIPYVDEANRGTTSYNNFENYTNLQLIAGHLNRIMRTKGDTEYKFTTEVNRSGVIECDDTPLYDLIFGEKGILKTFNVELVYDNYRVKFVEKRPSKNTEILFHEKKNISELQATVDFKEIITKLHVTCKYTPETTEEQKEEKERARAAKRLETFNKSQERIRQREEKQAKERALKRKKEEEDYKANRKKPKRTKAQIHAEHVQRQQEREKQILASNETRRAERERKFNEREQQRAAQRVTRKKEKEKVILKTVYVSPLVNQYARPYEASLSFDSKEINSEEALIAWCNANLFTEEDPRDVPLSNFSFKPTLDNYNVDINDRAMVNFESIDTKKVIHCCKIEYDALHDKYISIEFGELNKSTMKEAIGNLNAKISEAKSNISNGLNMIDSEIEAYVQKELEAYNELFDIEKEELEDTINQGFEDAKIEAEKVYGTINTELEEQLAPIREDVRNTVEAYNQQLQATKLELEKNKTDSIEKLKELTDRVNNVQDISTNPTVLELKQQVAEAKESGNAVKSKVTELEGSITREFSSVKSKTENDLNVVKAEFTRGVDGLTRKISSLEEYKNQDGTRTESLKQWVQRDTASQLSRERTEITRIVDNKGFVKNTEFSSKFNDNAQGINRKLDALETYKNQDGTRTSALKQWTQDNTASQLATARRSIESWVDSKGYVTTSVVNNKVQETANSFSREISNIRESIPTSLGGRNYITDSKNINIKFLGSWDKWEKSVEGDTLVLTKVGGSDTTGFFINLTELIKTQFQNETMTWSIDVRASRNCTFNHIGFETNGQRAFNLTTQWQRISHTFINKFTNYFAFTFYNPNITFNNGDKIYIRLPKLEKGNIATDWTPAPEDDQQSINELNSWKQTTTGTLNTVTSTLNDTVRHSQLQITADSINFGSNKVFNGQNLASMLSVSPDSIKAITDRLVITPANENLVRMNQRESITSSERDTFITDDIKEDLSDGAEFYFKAKFSSIGRGKQRIGIHIYVTYTDNSQSWGFAEMFPINSYAWNEERTATLKFEKAAGKKVKHYAFGIHQSAWDNFSSWTINELELYKKKSAELIVDGTIEGKHIKSSTIETGHLKAGSVTANIIASDAIESKHLKVDDGMIDKLVSNQAFVSKLWAKEAFINNLSSVKIKATQIETNWLAAYTGFIGGFRIGHNPHDNSYWLTGSNNFECGINQGINVGTRGAQLWAAWGNNWTKAGPNAWWVTAQGVMTCSNTAAFHRGINVYNARIDTHGNDIQGDANSSGSKTTVIWWSQINSVKSRISDKRLKTNIKPTKINALDTLNNIEIVEFNWKKDGKFEKIGAIAQQVQSVDKDLVVHDMDDKQTYNDYLRINYYDTIPYLIKAVQELSTENKELKQRISKLEEKANG